MSISSAIDALSSLLGDRLSRSKSDLDIHGQSETHFAHMPPDAVAYPTSTAEVAEVVKACAVHNCPITPEARAHRLRGTASPRAAGSRSILAGWIQS